MSQGLDIDLKEIVLSNSTFGPNEIRQLERAISEDASCLPLLRDSVHDLEASEDLTPAMAVRLGVCYYLLGHVNRAIETLSNADGSALSLFYLGRARFSNSQYDDAVEYYNAARNAGYNGDECALAICEAQRYQGDAEGALATLDAIFGAVEQTAEYLYQRGVTVAALGGNPTEVVALYERAYSVDPNRFIFSRIV